MYEVRNNAGEFIRAYHYVLQACNAAKHCTEKSAGERHYVTLAGIMVYETKGNKQ